MSDRDLAKIFAKAVMGIGTAVGVASLFVPDKAIAGVLGVAALWAGYALNKSLNSNDPDGPGQDQPK